MDAFHAIRDLRVMIVALWHILPWGERVLYVLTNLLSVLAVSLFVLDFDSDLQLGDIDLLLWLAFFSSFTALCLLIVWRKHRARRSRVNRAQDASEAAAGLGPSS